MNIFLASTLPLLESSSNAPNKDIRRKITQVLDVSAALQEVGLAVVNRLARSQQVAPRTADDLGELTAGLED
jgi:hypothetical protein